MAIILLIETSGEVCSVAVAQDGEVVAVCESEGGREHARLVANYAQEAMKQAGITPADLDAVAVSAGPGSYTGLRIGVSFAKGLCYSLGVKLIAVRSTESLARLVVNPAGLLCPLVDARRMEVYTEIFDTNYNVVLPVGALVVDENTILREYHNLTIFGSGAEKCCPFLPDATFVEITASSRGLARVAQQKYDSSQWEDVAYYEPLYLKDFVATTSKNRQGVNITPLQLI